MAGHQFDHDAWRIAFKEPFDPVVEEYTAGESVIRSQDFEGLTDASDVKERAQLLIARLNGAMALWNSSHPLKFNGVIQVDKDGEVKQFVFMAAVGSFARLGGSAKLTLIGADGKPVPAPPPKPSEPQALNELAQQSDLVSDLLDHFSRADNWYDIYKTIELAALLAGSKHKLWPMLAGERAAARDLDECANFYRHARTRRRPRRMFSLDEARPVLRFIVRTVIDREEAKRA